MKGRKVLTDNELGYGFTPARIYNILKGAGCPLKEQDNKFYIPSNIMIEKWLFGLLDSDYKMEIYRDRANKAYVFEWWKIKPLP